MTQSELVEPSFFTCPDYAKTLGPEVGELAALAGFAPDPEQQLLLDGMFALDSKGRSAAFEVGVVCCRQNMKTGLLKIAALGKTVVMERPLFVWSAHEFRTAQEAFRDLTILIESTPDLDRMVKKISFANGDEAIEWHGGQRIIFKARTNSGGRGLTGDDVALDEAFALKPEHMGALMPTLSGRPDPQILYASSAGLYYSEVLRGIRDRGREARSPRLMYAEWCAPGPSEACDSGDRCNHDLTARGCGFDKPDLVRQANPQLGRRITWDYVQAERQALPPSEYARERMGWWDEPTAGESPLPLAKWAVCSLKADRPQDVAFGVSVSPDLLRSVISVVGTASGKTYGETVEILDGTARLVDRLVELATTWKPCATVLNGAGAVTAFETDLTQRGFAKEPTGDDWRLVVLTAREYAQACMALTSSVFAGEFFHADEPPLTEAVIGARKRPLGDGWAWSRKDSTVDIGPLEALTLARHGSIAYGEPPDTVWFEFK